MLPCVTETTKHTLCFMECTRRKIVFTVLETHHHVSIIIYEENRMYLGLFGIEI